MKFKKGDIVLFIKTTERFIVYATNDSIDDENITLIDYNNENYMTSAWSSNLKLDVCLTRKLKIKKLINEIRKTKGTDSERIEFRTS